MSEKSEAEIQRLLKSLEISFSSVNPETFSKSFGELQAILMNSNPFSRYSFRILSEQQVQFSKADPIKVKVS